MRHRRQITNIVLSRGPKRRLKKKEKFVTRKKLEDDVQSKNKKEIVSNVKETKVDKFNLGDIDNTLLNMLSEIGNEKKVVRIDSKRKNKKNRQM